jgi:hypothetical protein
MIDGHSYCCLGCAMGGPCSCDYSDLPVVGRCVAIICTVTWKADPLPQGVRTRHDSS